MLIYTHTSVKGENKHAKLEKLLDRNQISETLFTSYAKCYFVQENKQKDRKSVV